MVQDLDHSYINTKSLLSCTTDIHLFPKCLAQDHYHLHLYGVPHGRYDYFENALVALMRATDK
jgi:hypothetical protein